jgi:type I restriction enzyme S subunit
MSGAVLAESEPLTPKRYWFGVIPSNWTAPPLRASVRVLGGGTPSKEDETFWNGSIPWASPKDMKSQVILDTEDHISEVGVRDSATQVVPQESVLVVFRSGILQHSLPTALAGQPMAVNQDLKAFVCRPQLLPRYLNFMLQGMARRLLTLWRNEGATVESLDLPIAVRTRFPLPPPATQQAIADYLDHEIGRIDALITAKRRTVELLEERWQAVMYSAAAGQLIAADRTWRSTTIPWLADLPQHWGEGLLKLIAKLGSGHTPSRSHPEWWVNPTIPWITTGEVAQMRSDRIEYITETRERISERGLANSSATLHPAGTVVLCRTASAGYSAIMASEMATSQDFAAWTCGAQLRPRFLLLCLRAMRRDLLGRLAMGSTHQTIYMPDIESIKVPIPPIEEQDEIVAVAHSKQESLEACSTALSEQIDLLQERRRALITAAVTGAFDIPEAP